MVFSDLKELPEEELIKRFCSDPSDRAAGEILFQRCLPKIRKFIRAWGSKHLLHLPRTVDRRGFLNDVESLAGDKLRGSICSFALKGSFEGWLRRIANSAAATEYLRIMGRGPQPRDFVPLEEAFRSKHSPPPFEEVRALERGEIMRKLLVEHAKESNRHKKSADAISLSTWEGCSAEEIAAELGITRGYTWNLISHDYVRLRKLLKDKFRVTTTSEI